MARFPNLISVNLKKERIATATEALAKVGLSDKRNNSPKQLSGGEQQRVAIARAIVRDPALLIADEPTGNLDSETAKHIMEVFHILHQTGKTILLVTHDAEIAGYATRRLTMMDGVLQS